MVFTKKKVKAYFKNWWKKKKVINLSETLSSDEEDIKEVLTGSMEKRKKHQESSRKSYSLMKTPKKEKRKEEMRIASTKRESLLKTPEKEKRKQEKKIASAKRESQFKTPEKEKRKQEKKIASAKRESQFKTPEKEKRKQEKKIASAKRESLLKTPEKEKRKQEKKIASAKRESLLKTPEKEKRKEQMKIVSAKRESQLKTPQKEKRREGWKIAAAKRYAEMLSPEKRELFAKNKKRYANLDRALKAKLISRIIYLRKLRKKNASKEFSRKQQFYRSTEYAFNGLKYFCETRNMNKPLERNIKIVNNYIGKIFADEINYVRNQFNMDKRYKGLLLENYLAKRIKYKYLPYMKNIDTRINLREFIEPTLEKIFAHVSNPAEIDLKQQLDIICFISAEYARNRLDFDNLEEFLILYHKCAEYIERTNYFKECLIEELEVNVNRFVAYTDINVVQHEANDLEFMSRKIGGFKFHLKSTDKAKNKAYFAITEEFTKIYNDFMGLESENVDIPKSKELLDEVIREGVENTADKENKRYIRVMAAITSIRYCDDECPILNENWPYDLREAIQKFDTDDLEKLNHQCLNFQNCQNRDCTNGKEFCTNLIKCTNYYNILRIKRQCYNNLRSMYRRYTTIKSSASWLHYYEQCFKCYSFQMLEYLASGDGLNKNIRESMNELFCKIDDNIHHEQTASEMYKDVMLEFKQKMEERETYICEICNLLNFQKNIRKRIIANIKFKDCLTENIKSSKKKEIDICVKCLRDINKNLMPIDAIQNDLFLKEIPAEIEQLNWIEDFMCRPVRNIMATVYLSPTIGRFSASEMVKAIHGTIIHMPVPIEDTLKHALNCLPNTRNLDIFMEKNLEISVRSITKVGKETLTIVNLNKIILALKKLKEINHLYDNIEVDEDFEMDLPGIESGSGLHLLTQDNVVHVATTNMHKTVPSGTSASRFLLKKHEGTPLPHFEKNLDLLSFPAIYPTGEYGMNAKRPVKMTETRFIHNRLRHANRRFMKPEYLFFLANYQDQKTVNSNIVFQCKKKFAITDAIKNNDPSLDENLTSFLPTLRGHSDYWYARNRELANHIRYFGPPTFFVTLNPAERSWPELWRAYEDVYMEPIDQDNIWPYICKDSGIFSRFYYNRINAFFKYVIKNTNGPFGEVTHHFHRLEYQNRGTTHVHLFLWIKGAPRMHVDSDQEVLDFISNHITCRLPDEKNEPELHKLVKDFQSHGACRPSCQRKIKFGKSTRTICRYGYPLPVSRKCKINTGNLHIKNLTGGFKKPYFLPRTQKEVRINSYNAPSLLIWKGNMDIQYIATASKSILEYVTNYGTKSESKGTKELEDAIKGIQNTVTTKRKMFDIAMRYLHSRQLGTIEACDRLYGHKYYGFDCAQQFISTDEPGRRLKVIKTNKATGEIEFMNNFIDDYYPNRPKILENYSMFNVFSNFQFSRVIPAMRKKAKDTLEEVEEEVEIEEDNDEEEEEETVTSPKDIFANDGYHTRNQKSPFYKHMNDSITYKLDENLGYLRLKTKQIVPQFYFPDFDEKNLVVVEEWYRRACLLFIPFRIEETLKGNFASYEEKYDYFMDPKNGFVDKGAKEDIDRILNVTMNEGMRNVEKKEKRMEERKRMQEQLDTLDEEESGEDTKILERIVDLAQHNDWVQKLNPGQTEIFGNILNRLYEQNKPKLAGDKSDFFDPNKQILMIVSGTAGTGKTRLINCLANKVTIDYGGKNRRKPSVIIAAPTGLAACIINGTTLHTLLGIEVQKGRTDEYRPLSDAKLDEKRALFENCKLILIDEFSMISNILLHKIHLRLCEISGRENAFGGFNTIYFGHLLQLPPVMADMVFQPLKSNVIKRIFHSIVDIINLWDCFEYRELTQNMRQADDLEYSYIMDRVSIGSPTDEDISEFLQRMISVLDNKEEYVSGKVPRPTTMEETAEYFLYIQKTDPKVLALFALNDEVEEFNKAVYKALGVNTITIKADDTTTRNRNAEVPRHPWKERRFRRTNLPISAKSININKKKIYIKAEKAGGLKAELELSIGCRVMLRRNMDFNLQLVNGSLGVLERFGDAESDGNIETLWIRYDHNNQVLPLKRVKVNFNLTKQTHQSRRQFPIVVAYGVTIHKCQGLSLKNLIVKLDNAFAPGMGFVSLSRATKLTGIHLMDFHVKSIYCSVAAYNESNRLRTSIGLPSLPPCNIQPKITKIFPKKTKKTTIGNMLGITEKAMDEGKEMTKFVKKPKFERKDSLVKRGRPTKKSIEEDFITSKELPKTIKNIVTRPVIPTTSYQTRFIKLENRGEDNCFVNSLLQCLIIIPEINAAAPSYLNSNDEIVREIGHLFLGNSNSVTKLRNLTDFPINLRIGQKDIIELIEFLFQHTDGLIIPNWFSLFQVQQTSTTFCRNCQHVGTPVSTIEAIIRVHVPNPVENFNDIVNMNIEDLPSFRCESGCGLRGNSYRTFVYDASQSPYMILQFVIMKSRLQRNVQTRQEEYVVDVLHRQITGFDPNYQAMFGSTWRAISTVIYTGSGMRGHYYSYCRVGSEWFKLEDANDTIKVSGFNQNLENHYVIFFENLNKPANLVRDIEPLQQVRDQQDASLEQIIVKTEKDLNVEPIEEKLIEQIGKSNILIKFKLDNVPMLQNSFINAAINCIRFVPELINSDFSIIEQDPQYEVIWELGKIFKQQEKSVKNLRKLSSFDAKLRSGYGNPTDFINFILLNSGMFEWNKYFTFYVTKKYFCENCEKVKGEKTISKLFMSLKPVNGKNDFTQLLTQYEKTEHECEYCQKLFEEFNVVDLGKTKYLLLCFESFHTTAKIHNFNEKNQEIFGFNWETISTILYKKNGEGHYYTYSKIEEMGKWMRYDDKAMKFKDNLKPFLKKHYVILLKKIGKKTSPIPLNLQLAADRFLLPNNSEKIRDYFWNKKGDRIKINSAHVKSADLKRLDYTQNNDLSKWFSDELINSYFDMIVERSKLNSTLATVYAFNSFLEDSMKKPGNFKRLLTRIYKSDNLCDKDILLFPINSLNMHWLLVLVDTSKRIIYYYDSMGSNFNPCIDFVRGFITDVWREKRAEITTWKLMVVSKPRQPNYFDCGLCVCLYAEHFTAARSLDYIRPDDLPFFRIKLLCELVTKTFCKELQTITTTITAPEIPMITERKDIKGKITLTKGDITFVKVEAIVNAANEKLLGGSGVDGAIHLAAGPGLLEECRKLNGCNVGEAKITGAYDIKNTKYIIHTVGPRIIGKVKENDKKLLSNCYINSLNLAKSFGIRSIVFPSISTGIYSFPLDIAANIAINTVVDWLNIYENFCSIDTIIFCLFSDHDKSVYNSLFSSL